MRRLLFADARMLYLRGAQGRLAASEAARLHAEHIVLLEMCFER